MIIEMVQEHARTLIDGFLERGDTFTIEIMKVSPEALNVVGWGIFIKTDNLVVRLRYIYKSRQQALNKVNELLNKEQLKILITTSLD